MPRVTVEGGLEDAITQLDATPSISTLVWCPSICCEWCVRVRPRAFLRGPCHCTCTHVIKWRHTRGASLSPSWQTGRRRGRKMRECTHTRAQARELSKIVSSTDCLCVRGETRASFLAQLLVKRAVSCAAPREADVYVLCSSGWTSFVAVTRAACAVQTRWKGTRVSLTQPSTTCPACVYTVPDTVCYCIVG